VQTTAPSYRCHRYPPEIIAQCVRLYYRFSLSYRDVEELMFERGVIVSYESNRRWCHKFGPFFAAEIRRQRPQLRDKWHLAWIIDTAGESLQETVHLWKRTLPSGSRRPRRSPGQRRPYGLLVVDQIRQWYRLFTEQVRRQGISQSG
jgi:hypothetical protein